MCVYVCVCVCVCVCGEMSKSRKTPLKIHPFKRKETRAPVLFHMPVFSVTMKRRF